MRPLEGIVVLDLSRVLSGPYCTMYLADMGARVIKVERPGAGDDTRRFGPPFHNGQSTYYLSINRGKESLALDLKSEEGRAIAQDLARRSDVVVQNFRPGVADRLGLGWETLHADNPRLVYASISGFGIEGLPEYSKLPGYDVVIQGIGGIPSLTGPADGAPHKVGTSIADMVAGMYALHGILLALYSRERTGEGRHVDVSMLDGQVSLLTYHSTMWWLAGQAPPRLGNAHPNISPYETYSASDGHFNLAVANDAHFRLFCGVIGRPALADEPRFATNAARVEHRQALQAVVGPLFAEQPVAHWLDALTAAGLVCGPINDVPTALDHPQLAARDMVVDLEHPEYGPVRVLGSPWKISGAEIGPTSAPPTLGEHSATVLADLLGLDQDTLDGLRSRGVIETAGASE